MIVDDVAVLTASLRRPATLQGQQLRGAEGPEAEAEWYNFDALNHDITHSKRWLQKASLIQQMLLPSERTQLETWQQKVVNKQKE